MRHVEVCCGAVQKSFYKPSFPQWQKRLDKNFEIESSLTKPSLGG
jgi:hypothetical protein